jgi:hypothetical protein
MNNNFNLKKFLAEGRLLKEDTQNDVNIYKQLLDKVPNEKYFQVLKDEEEDNAKYGISNVDPGDYYDYLYEPLFDNELKGKPGIGYNDFYELQEKEREEINADETGEVGPLERLIINKAGAIIKDYNQTSNSGNLKENEGADELPLTDEIKQDVDNAVERAIQDGEMEYLQDVGYWENDFEEYLLMTFEDQYPDVDKISDELHNYIQNKVYGE